MPDRQAVGHRMLFGFSVIALMNGFLQVAVLHFCNFLAKIVKSSADGVKRRGGDFLIVLHSQPVKWFCVALKQSQRSFRKQPDVSNVIAHIPEVGVKCLDLIVHHTYRHTNGEISYATEMMSGESGIDIVCFQDYFTSFAPLPMLLKNGAILDITDEPAIAALREHYRDLWDLVSANGRQYGVMTSTVPTLWEVDAKIAAQIGWEIPDGVWTWAEFDELIDLVITYNETAETPIDLLMDQGGAGYAIEQFDSIYLDYFAGTTNYDSEEYQQLIARQQKLALNGLLYEDDPSVWERDLDGNTLLRVDDHCVLAGMGQKTYILPPRLMRKIPLM